MLSAVRHKVAPPTTSGAPSRCHGELINFMTGTKRWRSVKPLTVRSMRVGGTICGMVELVSSAFDNRGIGKNDGSSFWKARAVRE